MDMVCRVPEKLLQRSRSDFLRRHQACVSRQKPTKCRTMSRVSFERKLIDGNQEGNNEKFNTDEVFLCKPR